MDLLTYLITWTLVEQIYGWDQASHIRIGVVGRTSLRLRAIMRNFYSGIYCYATNASKHATVLTPSKPAVPDCCCSKVPAPYWSNPPFLIFDIRTLWRSGLSARASECQKLKIVG